VLACPDPVALLLLEHGELRAPQTCLGSIGEAHTVVVQVVDRRLGDHSDRSGRMMRAAAGNLDRHPRDHLRARGQDQVRVVGNATFHGRAFPHPSPGSDGESLP